MKAVTQFAEFSITGGLLWFNVFLFVTIQTLGFGATALPEPLQQVLDLWSNWAVSVSVIVESVAGASLLGTILNAILSFLSVILLYLSGIALDLVAAVLFLPMEMAHFRRQARRGSGWLTELTQEHSGYFGGDFQAFKDDPLLKLGDPCFFFLQRRRYIKTSAFLLSYMTVQGGEARLDHVMDQVRVWRMARAFGASLCIFAVMLSLSFFFNASGTGISGFIWGFSIYLLIPILLVAAALGLAMGTYTKTNAAITAMTYATSRRQPSATA